MLCVCRDPASICVNSTTESSAPALGHTETQHIQLTCIHSRLHAHVQAHACTPTLAYKRRICAQMKSLCLSKKHLERSLVVLGGGLAFRLHIYAKIRSTTQTYCARLSKRVACLFSRGLGWKLGLLPPHICTLRCCFCLCSFTLLNTTSQKHNKFARTCQRNGLLSRQWS